MFLLLFLVEEEQVFLLTLPFGIFGWFYLFLSAAFGCPVDWQLAGLLWFFHLVARYELPVRGFFRRQFMLIFPTDFYLNWFSAPAVIENCTGSYFYINIKSEVKYSPIHIFMLSDIIRYQPSSLPTIVSHKHMGHLLHAYQD